MKLDSTHMMLDCGFGRGEVGYQGIHPRYPTPQEYPTPDTQPPDTVSPSMDLSHANLQFTQMIRHLWNKI